MGVSPLLGEEPGAGAACAVGGDADAMCNAGARDDGLDRRRVLEDANTAGID